MLASPTSVNAIGNTRMLAVVARRCESGPATHVADATEQKLLRNNRIAARCAIHWQSLTIAFAAWHLLQLARFTSSSSNALPTGSTPASQTPVDSMADVVTPSLPPLPTSAECPWSSSDGLNLFATSPWSDAANWPPESSDEHQSRDVTINRLHGTPPREVGHRDIEGKELCSACSPAPGGDNSGYESIWPDCLAGSTLH